MQSERSVSAFLPPPPRAAGRSMALSMLVHGLLVLALTWGLNWNRNQVAAALEAEVWSEIPAPAAPKAEPEPVAQPEPKPEPEPVVKPEPPPPPPPPAKAEKAPEPSREAEIAIAKQRIKEQEKARAAEAEKRAAKRKEELDRKEAEHQAKVKKLEQERLERDKKKELETKKREEAKKREDTQKREDDKKRKEQDAKAKRQEAEENRRIEEMRKANLARNQKMSLEGTSSNPDSAGTQAKSSGPSSNWGGRIQSAVLPAITFTDESPGNIVASVEVRLAPDGTIVNKKLIKKSGNSAWDDAVLRALDKTGKLPRDTDGRIPMTEFVIDFKPQDLKR